jgi:hypothetical protein
MVDTRSLRLVYVSPETDVGIDREQRERFARLRPNVDILAATIDTDREYD